MILLMFTDGGFVDNTLPSLCVYIYMRHQSQKLLESILETQW